MAVLVERFACRDGSEQSGSVEQEASINGSPEVRHEMVAGRGVEAIVNSLSKWVVSILFASIILLRHDGTALWGIIGSVSNSALSVVLKRILNQARPATTSRTDPGMPSTHAQSISFISVFAVLSVMEWLGTSKVSLFLSFLIIASGLYFIRLRVSQKLHTSSQVVVGAIVGSVFCIFWYTMWNSLLLEAFESSLVLQISVFLVAAALTLAFATHVVLNCVFPPPQFKLSELLFVVFMAVLVTRFARRDGREQQSVLVEQKASINGSPELRYELVAGHGVEAIVNRLSKWVVFILFASIILLRHDGTALWGIIGSVSNATLCVVLKRILNQARPATTSRTDPGMPSSHAQSISYISLFAILSVLEWLGTSKVSMFLSCLIIASGSYFIRLRVSQKLHTSSQVVVGAIVGSVFCIFLYTTWNSLLLEAFEASLLLQTSVFLVAAALTLAFAIFVVLRGVQSGYRFGLGSVFFRFSSHIVNTVIY
ncbi:unnamed protein product [Brassica oleracea]